MGTERPAVAFAGLDNQGNPLFDINLSIPEHDPRGVPATESQRASIEDFYLVEIDDLQYRQAHILLCTRDYARAFVKRVYSGYSRTIQRMLERVIAGHISGDEIVTADVVAWAERCFRDGIDDPQVRRTKHYSAIADFILDLENDVLLAGCDLARI